MRIRRIFQVLFVLATAMPILSMLGCPKDSAAESQPIRIGAVLLLSGDNALWGENAKRGILLAVDSINRMGGVDGRRIEVHFEDSRGEARTAVAAFKKLVATHRVPVVLGGILSSTTLAMAPLANEEQVVLIGISCSAPAVTDAGPFVYRVWPSDLYEGMVSADWARARGYERASLVFLTNDYGEGLKEAFKSRFTEEGGRIVSEDGYGDDNRDFRSIAAKVRAAQPDVVYVVGYYEDSAKIIQQFRQAGVNTQILGTSSSLHRRLLDIAGASAEGFVSAVVNDFDLDALNPNQAAFLSQYRAEHGEDPDWAATHGADALLVAAACLKAGARTGPEIKRQIDVQRSFEGINSGILFDANGDVVNKPIAMRVVQNGEFVSLER